MADSSLATGEPVRVTQRCTSSLICIDRMLQDNDAHSYPLQRGPGALANVEKTTKNSRITFFRNVLVFSLAQGNEGHGCRDPIATLHITAFVAEPEEFPNVTELQAYLLKYRLAERKR